MLLMERGAIKVPYALELALVLILPIPLSWSIYVLVRGAKALPSKVKTLIKVLLIYGSGGFAVYLYHYEILTFVFGVGGVTIAALAVLIFVTVVAIGGLVGAARFYTSITYDMPIWGHLIIAVFAPPMLVIIAVSVVLIYFDERQE